MSSCVSYLQDFFNKNECSHSASISNVLAILSITIYDLLSDYFINVNTFIYTSSDSANCYSIGSRGDFVDISFLRNHPSFCCSSHEGHLKKTRVFVPNPITFPIESVFQIGRFYGHTNIRIMRSSMHIKLFLRS